MRILLLLLLTTLAVGLGLTPEHVYSAGQPMPEPGKQSEPKSTIVLTDKAVKQIRELLRETNNNYLYVSCVGGKVKLDLIREMDRERDQLEMVKGISVLIERKSLRQIPEGMIIDYIDEEGRRGFKITFSEEKPDSTQTLVEARRGFKTKLTRQSKPQEAAPKPPPDVFSLVQYEAPVGNLAAYVTPDPKDGKKHAAIIWITGGDCNTIGELWNRRPVSNDQTASQYREAGLVMMFPSLRGGNDNPGVQEGFLGEVDDVIAAAAYLRKQPYVDPTRIYLGGHSTGGTLVLLVAECTDVFRAVFSFGPVDNVAKYGGQFCPFELGDREERRLRCPGLWLHCIRTPVFVFEGKTSGNADCLRTMSANTKNPLVKFFEIPNTNHFGLLAETNRMIAKKILNDNETKCNLSFTTEVVNKPFQK